MDSSEKFLELPSTKESLPHKKYHRKTCLVISLVFLTIPLSCILANGLGYLTCATINRTKSYDEQVDIQPMLDLSIPADMDISELQFSLQPLYTDWIEKMGGFSPIMGVRSDGLRLPTNECASNELKSRCFFANATVLGRPPNQYCISKVGEVHDQKTDHYWDPEFWKPNFCLFEGWYSSSVNIQIGDVLMRVQLHSETMENNAREKEIQRIAQEISEMVQEGAYFTTPIGKDMFIYYSDKCHGIDESRDGYVPYSDLRILLRDKPELDNLYSTEDKVPADLYDKFINMHEYRVYSCAYETATITRSTFNEIIQFVLLNPNY